MVRATRWNLGLVCLAMMALSVMAEPAEARRFRFFGIPHFGGGGETIDLVHDLPDAAPFEKDGEFLDVGYLNGRSGHAYVLYHGDRYRKLDAEGIAILTGALGFDPTAKHRAEHAAENAELAAEQAAEEKHKAERIAKGLLLERREGESDESFAARRAAFIAAHRSSSGSASASAAASASGPVTAGVSDPSSVDAGEETASKMGWLAMGGMLILFVLAARKLIGLFGGKGKAAAKSEPVAKARMFEREEEEPESGAQDMAGFDARVARRLAELRGEAGAPDGNGSGAAPASGPGLGRPPVRGFGRKGA